MELAPLFSNTGSVVLIALSCGLIFSALAIPKVRELSRRIEQKRPHREANYSLKVHLSGVIFGGVVGTAIGLFMPSKPDPLGGLVIGVMLGELIGFAVAYLCGQDECQRDGNP
jgi:uncharacterized membrane protein